MFIQSYIEKQAKPEIKIPFQRNKFSPEMMKNNTIKASGNVHYHYLNKLPRQICQTTEIIQQIYSIEWVPF